MGSGILFAYPQLATITGVQGLIIYAFSSVLPLLVFSAVGPAIRKRCPQGFVLTEWTRERYGIVAALFLGAMTLLTLFLYMVAELSAVGQTVSLLTGLDGLPVLIVECVVTTIYTCKWQQFKSPLARPRRLSARTGLVPGDAVLRLRASHCLTGACGVLCLFQSPSAYLRGIRIVQELHVASMLPHEAISGDLGQHPRHCSHGSGPDCPTP